MIPHHESSSEAILLVIESADGVRSHHVHVVCEGDGLWEVYLSFRYRLRVDGQARERYARVKRELAERFASDRDRYTEVKAAIIRELLGALAPKTSTD